MARAAREVLRGDASVGARRDGARGCHWQTNDSASVRNLVYAGASSLEGDASTGRRSLLARVKATAKALTAAVLRAAELASASSPARAWSAPAPLSHVDMQAKLHGGAIKDLGRAFRPRSVAVGAVETVSRKLLRSGIRRPFRLHE